jgi:hypothetical protein
MAETGLRGMWHRLVNRIRKQPPENTYQKGFVDGWNAAERWAFNEGWRQALEVCSEAPEKEE